MSQRPYLSDLEETRRIVASLLARSPGEAGEGDPSHQALVQIDKSLERLHIVADQLETTNEELQSSNEELEMVNEELQSANDELQALNDELRRRTEEADRAGSFLEAILACLDCGLVVVDNTLRVRIWNPQAEDLWGLRRDEVIGRSLLGLDMGLPVDRLREPLVTFIASTRDKHALALDAITRRGRSVRVHITLTHLVVERAGWEGVVLVMKVGEP